MNAQCLATGLEIQSLEGAVDEAKSRLADAEAAAANEALRGRAKQALAMLPKWDAKAAGLNR
ncbi:hypothetical protein B4Q13_20805, partial [Lacticaseibacillus rhamnosus]